MTQRMRKQPVSAKRAVEGPKTTASEYGRLLAEIRERVRSAQYEALRVVNKAIAAIEKCSPWLHKSPGRTIWSSSSGARTLSNASSIFGTGGERRLHVRLP